MSSKNGRDRGHEFPCASLDEALNQLRRPPSPGAVRFKIQNAIDDAAQIAAYIDARLVYDRLDAVAGGNWHASFEQLPESLRPCPVDRDGQRLCPPPIGVRCRLTVFGVTREDVGEGEDPKAAFSDAIKRAAVHFGVGRALYAMRAPWLGAGEADRELRRNRKGRLVLDERSEAECRRGYEGWLDRVGIPQFGEPLDHGDECAESDAGGRARAGARPALRPVEAEAAPDTDADHRAALSFWQRRGRYHDGTVATLGELWFGEPQVDRLTDAQLAGLAWQLELAVTAGLTATDLGDQVKDALAAEDRAKACERFTERLVDGAQEEQLLGKRAA